MFSDLTSFLKFNLIFISIYLSIFQFKHKNKDLGNYWIVVALYWFFNLLSGLNFK